MCDKLAESDGSEYMVKETYFHEYSMFPTWPHQYYNLELRKQ